jgi:hypothetical protein
VIWITFEAVPSDFPGFFGLDRGFTCLVRDSISDLSLPNQFLYPEGEGICVSLNPSEVEMAETVKKTKAAAKPRAPRKAAAPKSADPATQIHQVSSENHSQASHEPSISHEQVAILAHRFWKERGHNHGHHEDDWFRAERELRGRAS